MNTLRNVCVAMALLSLCGLGTAQNQAPPSKGGAPLDLNQLVKAVDTNRDGCMSHQEWKTAGLPESSYQGLKDKNGCVTLAKMQAEPAPPGIDLNGDGKLTVEEFREFDKRMSATIKNRPPQPPAPAH